MDNQQKSFLRVLLAEDEAINRLAVSQFLRKIGHQPTAVANGQEVLDALAAKPYDCVFMDIQMPIMNGLETTKALRSGAVPGAEDIPIIALTAHAMKGDREQFLAAGMDGYLSKPVEMTDLKRLLNDLTKKE